MDANLDLNLNPGLDLTSYFDVELPFAEMLGAMDMKVVGPLLMVSMPAVISVVRKVAPTVQFQLEKFGKKVLGLTPYEVEIRYKKQEREGVWEITSEECHQNKLLQTMVKMYVNTLKPYKDWVRSETSLMAEQEDSDDHPFIDPWDDDVMYGATSKALGCYSVVSIPEEGEWVEIEPGLSFLHSNDKLEDEEKNNEKEKGKSAQLKLTDRADVTTTLIIMKLRSKRSQPEQHIQEFLEKVMAWYQKRLAARKTDSKYMYQIYQPEPKKKKGEATAVLLDDDDADADRVYKRYKLESKKSFDTLFIPGKDDLLRLVDNFLNKRDVFSKPGFPDKLGLLLYGPPGTGKTTLIKCLAKYTNRNIVNINLARIRTNQELMDIMYEMNFNVEHIDDPVKLNFDDIIFVMEDIDCASEVVKSRDATIGMPSETTHNEDGQWDMTLTRTMTQHDEAIEEEETPDIDGETTTETKVKHSFSKLVKNGRRKLLGKKAKGFEGEEKEMIKAKCVEMFKKAVGGDIDEVVDWALEGGEEEESTVDESNGEEEEEEEEQQEVEDDDDNEEEEAKAAAPNSTDIMSDKLNLAGLLNALDGVIDTPGRIVIMTTNVQQSLDAALIRPGRVNLRIELGFMSAVEAATMFDYYFDATDTISRKEMRSTWVNNRFTPAELEQLCAEHDTLESLFASMEATLKQYPTRASMKKRKH